MDPSVLEDADLAALEHEFPADLQIDGGDFGDQLSLVLPGLDCDEAERRTPDPWLLLDSGGGFQAVSEDASQPGVEAAASEDDASAEVQWYQQVAEDFPSSDVESHHKQSQWRLVELHPSVPAASPRVTAEGYQTALSAAFHAVPAKATLSLPWESGVWSALFGAAASGDWLQQVTPAFNRPVQPTSGQPEESLVPASSGLFSLSSKPRQDRVFMAVVSQSLDVSWEEQRTLDFDRSVKLWLHTILRWDVDCEVRQMLCEEESVQGQIGLLEDFFRGRAPSTLLKRARALAKVANWLQEKGAPAYPISEKLFYEFLRAERALGAPASRLKGFHEAIVFSRFVLGVAGLELATASRRCLGATKSDEPRDRKQAQPLTVQQLLELHRRLDSEDEDPWNRLFCGATLCVAYARSRWGDAQHVCRWALDYDTLGNIAYLEITVASHKTMHSSQHRFQFLPMVSIALGVADKEWVSTWMRVRKQLGIDNPPGHCLMPAPDQEGKPLSRPLSSSEAGKWVRRLLDCEPAEGCPNRITSHSFKATLLSMAAKRGYSIEDRLQMGYHSVPGRMALVYSRDGAARSLRLLEVMLEEIRSGFYLPDSTRSGRLRGPAREILEHAPLAGENRPETGDSRASVGPEAVKAELTGDLGDGTVEILGSEDEQEAAATERAADSEHVTTDSSGSESSDLEEGNERVLECGRMVGQLERRLAQEVIDAMDRSCPADLMSRPNASCGEFFLAMLLGVLGGLLGKELMDLECTDSDCKNARASAGFSAKNIKSFRKLAFAIGTPQTAPSVADLRTLHFEVEAKSAISLEKQRGVAFDQCRLLSWDIHQKWVTTLMEAMCEDPCTQASRLVLGALPRGKVLKPLVPEFGRYLKVLTYPETGALLRFMRRLPKGSKVTSRFLSGGTNACEVSHVGGYLDTVDLTSQLRQGSFDIQDVSLACFGRSPFADNAPLHKGCKAECLSERCFQKGFITKSELSMLLDVLPTDRKFAKSRGDCLDSTKTWTSGAFHFSGQAGAVRVRPADPQEQELVLEVSQRPAKLDASLVHSTDDWSGDRILLVAFHVQGATSMSCADQRRCTELGFVLDVGAAGDHVHDAAGVNLSSAETVFVGVPSDPEEFIRQAVEAGHPMDMGMHVCPAVDRAIRANFCDPPELVIQRRLSTLERWEKRASVLDPLEAEANNRRPHHIQTLLKGKRILLWKELLSEIGYPDVKILDEVEQGLPLTGWMAESQVFASNPRAPTMSVDTVVAMNRGFHALVKRRLSKRQDQDVEQKTWLETEEEIAKGWFWIDESGCWEGKIIAHRFGLLQKLKLRTIDDCSVGGLNCTVGLPEKMRVHSIDILASMLRRALELCGGGKATCGWLGRTYDLQAAYRQFGISSVARELLRIVVNKPGAEQPILLGANSLPFGAVGSVAGFLRLSMAIWTLGLVGLELCWSAYYDDFPTVTSEPLLENTSSCVDRMFRLIGLDYATEGKKAPQFASCFAALGVQVDLQQAQSGSIVIGHTDARKEELTACIDSILADCSMTSKEAEKLRGRLVFFEGFTFGRVAQVAVKHVGRHAQGSSGSVKLSADVKWALGMIKTRICHALPVTISAKALQTTYVFTDGAFEQGRGSFGGVLISPHGRCVSYFAGEVSREAMHHLLASSTHPIYELELLPVLIAMQVWGRLSSHQQTVYYLDNEPARIGMIKGAGGTAIADLIISKASALECELGQHAWYARVPSHSNIADDPSRFYFERLHKLGAARVLLDESWVASLVLEAGPEGLFFLRSLLMCNSSVEHAWGDGSLYTDSLLRALTPAHEIIAGTGGGPLPDNFWDPAGITNGKTEKEIAMFRAVMLKHGMREVILTIMLLEWLMRIVLDTCSDGRYWQGFLARISKLLIVADHFREYDKWPWLRISSLEKQLQDHPSFVVAEVLFLILAAFSFLHAICESRDAEFRRLKLIWLATFIVGTVNDYIFMLLPVVDNFWQAQAVLMLTPRMPLYIPCVYNAFMYWPTVAAARVFCHRRKCPIAEASLAGLLAALLYAPYDMCGAKFLWWTWHDTDPGVALRWFGVPGGSTAWTLTFTFCFSLLLRWGSDAGWGPLRSLALACWSTPLMLVVLNVFTVLGWDRIGMPGPQTVLSTALFFSALCLWKPALKVWPQRSATLHLCAPEHWSVHFAIVGYFFALILIGLAFSPENQVSTGVHQEFGPCDATDIDLLGLARKRYICRERFPQDYFSLDCHGSTKDRQLAGIYLHLLQHGAE
ncbi:unnamed protein product [Symbiodinium sp. CCMP2592]|nr:unnamed protein product [Symbiodinium sp. CCMP2592]